MNLTRRQALMSAASTAFDAHHRAESTGTIMRQLLGADVPAADTQSFWGAFGCGCWAV